MMEAGSSKTKGSDGVELVQVNVDVASDLSSYGEFRSITELIRIHLETNRDVVKEIVEFEEDIWNNKELSSLVKEYLKNSIQTLEFFGALENCLELARKNQPFILLAVQNFGKEVQDDGEERKYGKTLDELNKFKAAEKPFDEEFIERFSSLSEQQDLLLTKLLQQIRKVDEKLKWTKTWRKLSNILFVCVFVSVVVFSVVAAATSAQKRPAVTAVAAALVVPVGSVGKLCSWLWNRYVNTLTGQKVLLDSMKIRTRYITIKGTKTTMELVRKMETVIESLLYYADFAIREQEAVNLVIDDITRELKEFMGTIELLSKRADECSPAIKQARSGILQKIGEPPSQSAAVGSSWSQLFQ